MSLYASTQEVAHLYKVGDPPSEKIESGLPFCVIRKKNYVYWYYCFIARVKRLYKADTGNHLNTYFYKGAEEAVKVLDSTSESNCAEVKENTKHICRVVLSSKVVPLLIA